MAQEKIKATVHLFCGLPTAGKTTLAKELEQSHNAVRFTLDEWMIDLSDASIFDDEYGMLVEKLKERIWQTAVSILQQGIDVILDWSLWNPERRQKWTERVTEMGAEYILYYLNIPPVVLRQRLQARNDSLPDGAHALPLAELDRFAPLFQPPKPVKAKSNFSIAQHIIAWIIFIALGTIMYFIRYKGFLLDNRQLDIMKTYAPRVFLGFNILIILKAFSDNILQGILTLLIPGYSIIYLLFISDDFYARAVFAGLMVGMGEDAWLTIHDYAMSIYNTITNWLSWD